MMDYTIRNRCCTAREIQDHPKAVLAAEREMAQWFVAQTGARGVEVHADPDATWIVAQGMVWANRVLNVRLNDGTAETRLDRILRRYRATKRGVGFWISPFARPADLSRFLPVHGLRCRKHFPVMFCELKRLPATDRSRDEISISVIEDHSIFKKHAHPYFGDISTRLRQFELGRLAYLSQQRPRRVWELVAWRDGIPVSACTIFRDGSVVGFHDVATLRRFRGQGIATFLMHQACRFAREQGCKNAVLLASGQGYGMYQRAGFRDVGSISYWYRTFQPDKTMKRSRSVVSSA
jgi:GNAT superfamily N-acetyltransferase